MDVQTDQLLELVKFRREALSGFLVASTILGAFSMSGVLSLLAGHSASKTRSTLFVLMIAASLLFTTATLIAVIIMPHMGRTSLPQPTLRGLLTLSRAASLALLAGAIVHLGALAGTGYLVSRRVGRIVTCACAAALLAFAVCAVYLIKVLP